MKTIAFKSIPENFRKEYLGLKSNTVRDLEEDSPENDIRRELLKDFIGGKLTFLTVQIKNTITEEYFLRNVTDVTKFDGLYIISWKHENLS
jgi:hypothetical protein